MDRAHGTELSWRHVGGLFDAARRIESPCFVYFIGEDNNGPFKIGKAKDPIQRLRGMQTGNSRRLCIERILVGDMAIEKMLHEMWEPHAIRSVLKRGKVDVPPGTEWFQPDIRGELFPVIETAAKRQVQYISEVEQVIDIAELEAIVRGAHRDHGITPHRRDEVRLLGSHGGYVVKRRSRV